MKCAIDFVGLSAAGMPSWLEAQSVFRNERAYQYAELPSMKPQVLPPNERRRATTLIKIALQAACEVSEQSGLQANTVPNVFASSLGDMEITDRICRALATDEKSVSPTQFHNSVHNAPAGYWSIATASRQNSISLSAHDASFAAGLLEAACLVNQETEKALLVAYDVVAPEPLHDRTGVSETFAVALLLSRQGRNMLDIELCSETSGLSPTVMQNNALEKIRRANPAARSLPLLNNLANETNDGVFIPYLNETCLKITVQNAG